MPYVERVVHAWMKLDVVMMAAKSFRINSSQSSSPLMAENCVPARGLGDCMQPNWVKITDQNADLLQFVTKIYYSQS